jgi:hypothetical protein
LRALATLKSAGFTGAFFFGGLTGSGAALSDLAASGFAGPDGGVSGWVASGLAATWRGGASSGRSAGSSGAICGIASHTYHWQIL